ncbi:hypothetical protein P175DRAFT_0501987 [Aspergillus ochraceoroseus IBT 24754]|uniref:Uncharacterized protein n=2 Tax=Aspergillus subgen. Nidulantes TaxID=2720870 RepID=A0A0F8WY92_9EURO|nr:uncharacterized protein P175DRAFT_0501987 [Aspergillus ochraceoroseus IBT 24754]KKK22505.1 hypothetical protein ARAM_000598 [Aspergillus rambellii]PTU19825.1 hypothetical protein P175DRAFT_0501987 [Aspergillus ochraceoroseus IBT 24754]
MKSATSTKLPNGHGSLYKEVRFSPTATPIRRSQSVPNAHPTLDPDYAQTLEGKGESIPTLAIAYLEQSRSVLDRQRISFNHERTLFAEERLLWAKERELLKLRIKELESLLKSRGVATTVATGAIPDPAHHTAPTMNSQVWEGSFPMSRPTRVFPDTGKLDHHLSQSATALEQGPNPILAAPSLDAALSPKSHAIESTSIPVPIEKLDSTLDGITLKSSALPPEIVARVMTPPSPSSRETSPSVSSQQRAPGEHRNSLKLKLSELGPPENNRVRDAGHTPMAVIDRDVDTEQPSPTEGPSVESEDPLAPSATRVQQPAENSSSYFSGGSDLPDLPDDPALKGPLSLLNEREHDDDFLQEVDQRLLNQARLILGHRRTESQDTDGDDTEVAPTAGHGEQELEIKFKNTTNFGTAFGKSL